MYYISIAVSAVALWIFSKCAAIENHLLYKFKLLGVIKTITSNSNLFGCYAILLILASLRQSNKLNASRSLDRQLFADG